jgi:hypothetical protein
MSGLLDALWLHHADSTSLAALGLGFFILLHLLPWLLDVHDIRSVPGPWLAKFSDLWLGKVAADGHRSEVIHEMHQQFGEQPHHFICFTPAVATDVWACPARGARQALSFVSRLTTFPSPTRPPSRPSTRTGTDRSSQISMTRLSQSPADSSTHATVRSTPASAKLFHTYFLRKAFSSSSRT